MMNALEHTSMVNVNLFSNVMTLIVNALSGVVLFNEKISAKIFGGFMCTLLSVTIPYLSLKKDRASFKGILFCVLIALNGALVKIIMKLYYTVPNYMDVNVFFFYTNVFMIPFVLFMQRKAFFSEKIFNKMTTTYKKPLIVATLAVITATVSTQISMIVVGKLDLIVSTAISPAVTICICFFFDVMLFKEKVGVSNIISMILAILAMLIMI